MHRMIFGLRDIGEVLHRSPRTISRWIDEQGLPACKLPNGNWLTSTALIDTWIMARGQLQQRFKQDQKLGGE